MAVEDVNVGAKVKVLMSFDLYLFTDFNKTYRLTQKRVWVMGKLQKLKLKNRPKKEVVFQNCLSF
jgi:hypothetical protein